MIRNSKSKNRFIGCLEIELNATMGISFFLISLITFMFYRTIHPALPLTQAYTFVRDPNKSITDIALDVGFKDVPHFSTCFKRQFGKNPSEMRKNAVKVNEDAG